MPSAVTRVYTHEELKTLWIQAGGDPAVADVMAYIAEAESSGDPKAVNPTSGAAGLWQIYFGPGRGGSTNPLTNAKQAVQKYKSQGLGAWDASRNVWEPKVKSTSGGSSLLDKLKNTAGDILLGPKVDVPSPGDAFSGISQAIQDAFKPLYDIGNTIIQVGDILIHPRRMLKLVFGGIILLWGINLLAKNLTGVNPARSARRASVKAATAAGSGGTATGVKAAAKTAVKSAK